MPPLVVEAASRPLGRRGVSLLVADRISLAQLAEQLRLRIAEHDQSRYPLSLRVTVARRSPTGPGVRLQEVILPPISPSTGPRPMAATSSGAGRQDDAQEKQE